MTSESVARAVADPPSPAAGLPCSLVAAVVTLARMACLVEAHVRGSPTSTPFLEDYAMRRLLLTVLLVMGLAPLVNAQTADKPKPQKTKATKTVVGITTPINLNTATVAQLDALPGVGTSTAQRIVEYRQKNGPFKKIEELMNVKGIGEKSFLKLKPLITVSADKADHASGQD
jgi:comEA protein